VALVVDDHPRVRQVVSLHLARLGLEAITVDNAQNAIELAGRHRPLVIVLDVMLPLTDGVTAIESLRRNSQTMQIPIVIVTANLGRLVPLRAGWTGSEPIALLHKPFTAAELHAAVRQALGSPSRSDSRGTGRQ
jgi:CheY-like chemotaxis protein